MTVCIAAICEHSTENPRIILCTDGKGSTSLGSKEYMLKNRVINYKWRVLTAGGDDDLNCLVPLIQRQVRDLKSIDETNVVPALRSALKERKLQRSNEYTQGRYGLSYEEFLRDGKTKLPDDQFRSDMFAISQIELNIDCIVAGFSDSGFAMLLKLDGRGAVTIMEDFAVAGEGAYLAQSGLMHRQHDDCKSFPYALYYVYEAKKYAERISSVNDFTSLSVLNKDGAMTLLTAEGKSYLEEQYKLYSPQLINKRIEVQPNFFQMGLKPS